MSTDWLGKSVWLTWGKLAEPSTVKKTLSQTCHQVMGRVFGLIFIIICMKRYYYGLLSKFYSSLQDFRIKWDTNNFTHTYLHNCCIWFATHVSYGIWILYFLSISVFNLLLVFLVATSCFWKINGGLRFVGSTSEGKGERDRYSWSMEFSLVEYSSSELIFLGNFMEHTLVSPCVPFVWKDIIPQVVTPSQYYSDQCRLIIFRVLRKLSTTHLFL